MGFVSMTKSKKTFTAKQMLSQNACLLSPRCFYDGLIACGAMQLVEYTSSTGSGEIKTYERISESHLQIGVNKENVFHHCKTEPRFYADTFIEAYKMACNAIAEHAKNLS